MTAVNDIRRTFLDFFVKNGHEVVPSSPLVPRNDPTLMFTNAGMVQFKNVFTGQETRPYTRAATSQKCVRAGGKHNDLDNVGYTARHHTFFEMLGNFSFGDYFKERAIELAWELLTKDFGLDPKRLTVTVYHADDEAYGIWKKLTGFGDDKIIRIATSRQLLADGRHRPVRPVLRDLLRPRRQDPRRPARLAGRRRRPLRRDLEPRLHAVRAAAARRARRLPKPSIDTGMGLERIAAVLQGMHDNYEIDLFRALIAASVQATGVAGDGRATRPRTASSPTTCAPRASSSPTACCRPTRAAATCCAASCAAPCATRHLLGADEPLMYRLVPALVHEMGDAYPELRAPSR